MGKAEYTVSELVAMVERGDLRLPEMQRRYVWRSTRVRDLLDSLYRGYPSGVILIWETDEPVPLQDFAVAQQHNPYSTTKLLLDGQQRLTSLSSVIRGEPVRVRGRKWPIEILFNLEHPDQLDLAGVTEVQEGSDEDLPTDDTTELDEDELQARLNERTFVVATKKLAALPQWVKVSQVFQTDQDAPFLGRAGVERIDDSRYQRYSQRLARLRGIRDYLYRVDVLEPSMNYAEVTEIFVRVNSLGVKLRSSDLALAQITAKWRGSLDEFQQFQSNCAALGFDLDLGAHLKALMALATGQSRFQTVAALDRDVLEAAWARTTTSMQFAINFLKTNVGITSSTLLSSPFLLVTLAYYGELRGGHLDGREADRVRFWARLANAKGRYSRGSSETLLDQDLATLRDGGDVEGLVDRLRLLVGRLDVTPEELQGRNQRSALFKTMYLAFKDDHARDWSSNLEISLDHSGAQDKLQFHHIFPKALLSRLGRTAREADDIANLAFISGGTNRRVSDKPPAVYLEEIAEPDRNTLYRTQCIPADISLLDPSRYDEFLISRRELIAERLNEYLSTTGHLEPAHPRDPQLVALDQRIEAVEVSLRELIAGHVTDPRNLPQHAVDQAKQRRDREQRRKPGQPLVDDGVAGLLAYCDLSELEGILQSKPARSVLGETFGPAQQLQTKFAQLANLRNAIRHSRPLDDITKKEGEAALLWFADILS